MKYMLLAGVLLIVLAGCVSLEISESIAPDGRSDVVVVYDMSALMDMMAGFDESAEMEEENPCAEFDGLEGVLSDASCAYDDGIMTISGSLMHGEDVFRVSKSGFGKTTYEYDVSAGMRFADALAESDTQGESLQGSAMFKQIGGSITYTVQMPGQVVSATHGVFEGDRVVIDMLEVRPNERIVIVAESGGSMLMIIGGIVAAVLMLGILLLVVVGLRKK